MTSTKAELFESIYEEYRPMVFQLCIGFMKGDQAFAADLTQDVFINTWNALSSYRGEASYKTWVYRITVNTCLQYLRKEKKKNQADTTALEDLAGDKFADTTTDNFNHLYKAIGELNDLDRLIIMMVLEELDYPEISQVVGISDGNLRVRIHRIKQKLKQILQNGH
jgi:RNA polymerase sigma factor (sigma-70 family)